MRKMPGRQKTHICRRMFPKQKESMSRRSVPEGIKGPDVWRQPQSRKKKGSLLKKKLGDTMPLDVALRKLLHPELEELTADDFQDETAPMDFNFEDEEESDLI